jgi:hypothetical protein
MLIFFKGESVMNKFLMVALAGTLASSAGFAMEDETVPSQNRCS